MVARKTDLARLANSAADSACSSSLARAVCRSAGAPQIAELAEQHGDQPGHAGRQRRDADRQHHRQGAGPVAVAHQFDGAARVDPDKLAFRQLADLLHGRPEGRQIEGRRIERLDTWRQPFDPVDDPGSALGILGNDGDDRGKLAAPEQGGAAVKDVIPQCYFRRLRGVGSAI